MPSKTSPTIQEPEPIHQADQPAPPEIYNDFIGGIALRSIRLNNCHVSAPQPYTSGKIVANINPADASYSATSGGFIAEHILQFDGMYEGVSEPGIRIRVSYVVDYGSRSPMTDAIFSVFKYRNLPANTWPFFREFIHSALGRAGWPALVIPALMFGVPPRRLRRQKRVASGSP